MDEFPEDVMERARLFANETSHSGEQSVADFLKRKNAFARAIMEGRSTRADAEIDQLRRERDELRCKVYVPGQWRCPKCSFVLFQRTISAVDGSVGINDTPGEKCPNCDSPLWRMSWKDNSDELELRCVEQMYERKAAEARVSALEEEMTTRPVAPVERRPAADQIIGQIEERFPNWRGYRDLIDCIDCTLHDLRAARRSGTGERAVIEKIAQIATAVGFHAGEPALEAAGQIVSVLAANPEQIGRFMSEGSELFIDGTFNTENGSLTYRSIGGDILHPSVLRQQKGRQQ